MSAHNFDQALEELWVHEGGFVDDPRDPGGRTKYGISQRAYPYEDIVNMTRVRAAQIYKRDYWDACKCDELPDGLDLVVFDAAVNSGRRRSAQWLQRALGVADDGNIGPITLAAAQSAIPDTAIHGACHRRLEFLRLLDDWPTFGRGWTKRVEAVRASGLALAASTRPMPRPVPPTPKPRPVGLLEAWRRWWFDAQERWRK